jgi:hypothetical protein
MTQLSWIDAKHFGVNVGSLPKDVIFTGVGGVVQGYLLQKCTLT